MTCETRASPSNWMLSRRVLLAILVCSRLAALLDFAQTMAQRADQRVTPITVIEQVIFQIGVALHHPNVAEHLVKHARRATGDALAAQFVEHRPVLGAEQADDDLAVGERRIVVRDFAQAGSHRCSQDPSKGKF